MRSSNWMLTAALLVACSGQDKDEPTDDTNVDDGDADTDADSDTDADVEPCISLITSVDPEGGDDMVPLDKVVTATFDVAVPATGTYSIAIEGVTGTSALAADGLSMTFTPDAPLAPETEYTIDAMVCESDDSSTFTTLPPPTPITDVEGNTYALRWTDITITQPGQPALLNALIPIDFVLLQVMSIDPVTLAAPSAATIGTDDGAGNAIPDCDTIVQEQADFSLNPYFQFNGNLQITIDPTASPPTVADVEDFHLQALLSADGTQISEIGMRALVAPEQFLTGLDCSSLAVQAMQPTCLPCAISATGECMLLEGTAPIALVQPALDLVTECGL